MTPLNPSSEFWQGKRVLLTGHTGFKGAWLALWLNKLGAEVTGVGLKPNTDPSLFYLTGSDNRVNHYQQDIRDSHSLAQIVKIVDPQVVFHLAAQALVRVSYREPLATYATNIQGTANLLDAVRHSESTRVVVVVTSDKVYQNVEHNLPYREFDPLGGYDPYSASKAASELVVLSYRDAFLSERGVVVATARAGNVIGGGDWSEDRLIPDAIRAWENGLPLKIRKPEATRPWQHVLEPASAYLRLAQLLWSNSSLAGAYNFGPVSEDATTVREVALLARDLYGSGVVKFVEKASGPHETKRLSLDISKSRQTLDIHPRLSLEKAVSLTMNWYLALADGASAHMLCEADIATFEALGV